MADNKIIYTIGTGLRSSEDFIETLLFYDISAFVDVRSFPRSKLPHFSMDALSELLTSNGIEYFFLGRELGGLRKGGYPAYTITGEFSAGIDRLEAIAIEKTSVIACSEHFPWKCHRKWIARELHKRGWPVRHIIDKGKIWEPK
ncbi:MAG: DUF488 domain-containing protein [Nitrospirae bacterium]|nr:DUF488 domain-containing protein [Nitrospirota bacterium]